MKKYFITILAIFFLATFVSSQTIGITVTDSRAEPSSFNLEKFNGTDTQWKNTFWYPQGFTPTNNWDLQIYNDKVNQVNGKITVKPSTVNNYWVITATPIKFDNQLVDVKIDMYKTGNPNNLGTACFTRTLQLNSLLTEQWEILDATSGCGAVARVHYNFIVLSQTSLKFKDFAIKENELGNTPKNEGESQKLPTDVSGGNESKGFRTYKNAKVETIITAFNEQTQKNKDQEFKDVLTARASNPWNDESGSQIEFIGSSKEVFVEAGNDSQFGDGIVSMTIPGTQAAWSIKFDKIDEGALGAQKFVQVKVYKNANASGTPCYNVKHEFATTAIIPRQTTPIGNWQVIHAPSCGVMFNAKATATTDRIHVNEFGPTFAQIDKMPKLKEKAASTNATNTAKENQEKDNTQTKTDKSFDEREAEEFKNSGGKIKRYYIRYNSNDIQQIGAKLKVFFKSGLLGFIGVGDNYNETEIYKILFSKLKVSDKSGRQLAKQDGLPLFGCERCMWLNLGIKLDRVILTDGTTLGKDATYKPAIVLGNVSPGVYDACYKFARFGEICMEWGISADPNSPIKERLISTGAS